VLGVTKILCVEDNEIEGQMVVHGLTRDDWECDLVSSGEEALELALAHSYRLALLDWNLAGELSGPDVCRELRARRLPLGIVLVSGRLDANDKILALDVGADDYVTKPFVIEELAARVRAVLRRYAGAERISDEGPSSSPRVPAPGLAWGPFEVRFSDGSVFVDGVEQELTKRQERILVLLLANVGQVVTNDVIWKEFRVKHRPVLGNIRAHIASLRRRLGRHGALIQTFRGVGYGIAVNKENEEEP
jgi:DNA-binding response OmpR family regulator